MVDIRFFWNYLESKWQEKAVRQISRSLNPEKGRVQFYEYGFNRVTDNPELADSLGGRAFAQAGNGSLAISVAPLCFAH
jgi:hypothetical protein